MTGRKTDPKKLGQAACGYEMTRWKTDTKKLAQAARAFEVALPGWWWSVGMCSVGAHASCAVDGNGPYGHLLDGVKGGHPFDVGFDCDTSGGQPHEALEDVMNQALEYLKGATQ